MTTWVRRGRWPGVRRGMQRGPGGALVIADPTEIPGLVAWFDAGGTSVLFEDASGTTPANDDGDVVGTWRDLSGNSNDLAQGTAANQPTRQNAEVNGRTVVRLDGSNDQMTLTASLDLSSGFAIFIVHKTSGDGMFFSWSGGNHQVRIGEGAANVLSAYDGTTAATSGTLAIARTEWALVEYLFNGSAIAFFQNGVAAGGGAFAGFTDLNLFGIFPGGAVPLSGDVAEIVIYDAPLSNAKRQAVESYLIAKYAL